jgi:hypothetical protein
MGGWVGGSMGGSTYMLEKVTDDKSCEICTVEK